MIQGVIIEIGGGKFKVASPTRDGIDEYSIMDDCLPENASVGAAIAFSVKQGLVESVNTLEGEEEIEIKAEFAAKLAE